MSFVQRSFTLLIYTVLLSIELYGEVGTKQMFEAMRVHRGHVAIELTYIRDYKFCWATLWNFVLQIFFLSLAILDELSRFLNLPSGLQKLLGKSRAYIFSSLVFPCSALVVFTFWSIWAVDRELIFPKALDSFFPTWLNHVLHTFILIPLAIEVLLPKTENFIKFKNAAPALLFFAGLYQAVYFSIYLRDGVWLYPIYKVLSIPQMLVFNLFQVLLILGFQYLGIYLQNTKMKQTEAGKKKVK